MRIEDKINKFVGESSNEKYLNFTPKEKKMMVDYLKRHHFKGIEAKDIWVEAIEDHWQDEYTTIHINKEAYRKTPGMFLYKVISTKVTEEDEYPGRFDFSSTPCMMPEDLNALKLFLRKFD